MACGTGSGVVGETIRKVATGTVLVHEHANDVARAEALNMAMATYVQNQGSLAGARTAWASLGSEDARFNALRPFLSFAETNRSQFLPSGYSVAFPAGTNLLVTGPNGAGKSSLFRCGRAGRPGPAGGGTA